MGKKAKSLPPTDSIEQQLERLHLQLEDVSGDGNCLFRSIALQMQRKEELHGKYRADIVKHMSENRELYEPFVDDSESLDQRLRRMSKPGVYGDNVEIVAFSRAFGVAVAIHQLGKPVWIVDVGGDSRNGSPQIIHIVYHSWEHYSSVIPLPNSIPIESRKNVKVKRKDESKLAYSVQERIVLQSIPPSFEPDVEVIRRLLREYNGSIGDVVEAFISECCVNDNVLPNEAALEEKVNFNSVQTQSPVKSQETEVGSKRIDVQNRKQQSSKSKKVEKKKDRKQRRLEKARVAKKEDGIDGYK